MLHVCLFFCVGDLLSAACCLLPAAFAAAAFAAAAFAAAVFAAAALQYVHGL